MRVVNAPDLVGLRSSRQEMDGVAGRVGIVQPGPNQIFDSVTSQLTSRQSTVLKENIWGAFFALYGPQVMVSSDLRSLRANYLGQFNVLLAAEQWASTPSEQSTCTADIDLDGDPECVLASQQSFIVVELDTGALAYVFMRTDEGVHQVIAPTSQLAIGTSDPSTWDLTAGMRSDPNVIPGGFADALGPYEPSLGASQILLRGNRSEKIYRLFDGGILIEITSQEPGRFTVPLIIDPWKRFQKGWGEGYLISERHPGTVQFGTTRILLQSEATVEIHTFTESHHLTGAQEDPNLDYPPGHALPFPLTLATIESTGTLQMLLLIEE